MLTSELIILVKGNLGARSSGKIGIQDVDDAILEGINKGIRKLCINCIIRQSEYIVKVDIAVSTNSVAIPTKDINDVDIEILEIISYQLMLDGKNETLPISYVTTPTFDMLHDYGDSSNTGRPSQFTWYGDKLYFGPYTDQAYDLYLKVRALPAALTNTEEEEIPLASIWLEALECYATYHCYHKLQQVQVASTWLTTFNDQKEEVMHLIEKRPALNASVNDNSVPFHLNPFYRRSV